MSLPEMLRWAEFYRWEIESQLKAHKAASEQARLDAQVESQLAAYRR